MLLKRVINDTKHNTIILISNINNNPIGYNTCNNNNNIIFIGSIEGTRSHVISHIPQVRPWVYIFAVQLPNRENSLFSQIAAKNKIPQIPTQFVQISTYKLMVIQTCKTGGLVWHRYFSIPRRYFRRLRSFISKRTRDVVLYTTPISTYNNIHNTQ